MIDHVFDMYIDSQEKELSTRLSDASLICAGHILNEGLLFQPKTLG